MRCARNVRTVGYFGPLSPNGEGDRSNYRVPIHRAAQILTQSKNLGNDLKQTMFHTDNARLSKSAVFAPWIASASAPINGRGLRGPLAVCPSTKALGARRRPSGNGVGYEKKRHQARHRRDSQPCNDMPCPSLCPAREATHGAGYVPSASGQCLPTRTPGAQFLCGRGRCPTRKRKKRKCVTVQSVMFGR